MIYLFSLFTVFRIHLGSFLFFSSLFYSFLGGICSNGMIFNVVSRT